MAKVKIAVSIHKWHNLFSQKYSCLSENHNFLPAYFLTHKASVIT